jgi:hypothetical protein
MITTTIMVYASFAVVVCALGFICFLKANRIELLNERIAFLENELRLALQRAPTHINTITAPPPLNAEAIARGCEDIIVRLNKNEGAD